MIQRKVAVILFYDSEGNILIQDRRGYKPGKSFGFFGGGIESEEDPKQAINRETREELGIGPKGLEFFRKDIHFNKTLEGEIELNLFLAKLPDLKGINCKEGKLFVTTFLESRSLDLSDNDKMLIEEVHFYLKNRNRII